MKNYRRKPVVIQAKELIFSTDSQQDIIDWSEGLIKKGADGGLVIPTLEGNMRATTGDFIIKGIKGEFYPCKPDIFLSTYEDADIDAWTNIKDDLPPENTFVLGKSKEWIDEDFNEDGIRLCFLFDDAWNSTSWNNDQDAWDNERTSPTHWKRIDL